MTDRQCRPVFSAASRSILASNRRTVTWRSSVCSLSAATASTIQEARVAVTVPRRAIPPTISPEGHQSSGRSHRVVIAVTNRGHRGDRPPDRVAEVADVGIGA
jgi:hypothetical protein